MKVVIVLWNTVYAERVANALCGHGQIVKDPVLRYLSLLGWQHIHLTGDDVVQQCQNWCRHVQVTVIVITGLACDFSSALR